MLGGLIGKLGDIVGKDGVLTEARDLERYATDATGVDPGGSYVVVLPSDAGEVAAIVGVALEEELPLVPWGGGTGLRGGAVPIKGGIVVSTGRMNQDLEIHREDLYVVAGAGVVTGDLIRQVESQGLLFPVDPASAASSTVGGNVADAAVGMHGIKYGAMRNYVLGLELVTPEGRTLKVGAKTVKSVAGYDLTRLMVGAEGILGIVASVTLKVLPMPEDRRVLVFNLPDGPMAAAAAHEIVSEGFGPAALEIADPVTVAAADSGRGPRAELLVEFHGTKVLCEGEASKLKEMVGPGFGATLIGEAGYPEAGRLWSVRAGALAALSAAWPGAVVMGLALPRGRMEGMVREIGDISRRYGTRIGVFGHAGEGRLHAVVPGRGAASAPPGAEAAISEITNACVNQGGSAWSEKAMGHAGARLPRGWLSETTREVLTALKKSVDPKGIMNPGKLLDES